MVTITTAAGDLIRHAHALWAVPKPGRALEKHLGRVAEQHLADRLVVGIARLDLLREGVDVAEAALEGAPGEDCVNPCRLVGVVGDRDGAGYRMRAGEACAGAVGDVDRR